MSTLYHMYVEYKHGTVSLILPLTSSEKPSIHWHQVMFTLHSHSPHTFSDKYDTDEVRKVIESD